MERGHDYHDHREYEDLLAAAALGALSPEEHAALQRHLERCESCRSTFGGLLAVAEALPLQVDEVPPSSALRDRLRAQIEPEAITAPSGFQNAIPVPPSFEPDHHASRPVVLNPPSKVIRPLWGLVAAAMLALAVLVGVAVDRFVLRDEESNVETIALQYPADVQSEQGTLEYLPDQDVLHFVAPDLPAPPEDHVYQAWLIDEGIPRPVGVVDPETGEFVTKVDRAGDDVFAITVEPGPLGSAAPSTDPVIVATLSEES